MYLVEREEFLASLQSDLRRAGRGEGCCVMLAGEAGMGKTSVVRQFCAANGNEHTILQGTCDALFTPRPLAPLYDIAWQLRPDLWPQAGDTPDRAAFFSSIFRELSKQKQTTIIVFEDVHWADEATLDFVKFLGRRISQLSCLFILTYRDNEIYPGHPLRNVLGQLPVHSLTRLTLTPLTRPAVEKLAAERGYSGEDVYSISGGNPFYVNEILAGYSEGVPDNIKDSILSVYNQQTEKTKRVWEILSVLPTGFELKYLEKMEPSYIGGIEHSISSKILILNAGIIFFKHELYRRTIEASLSPFVRIALNKRVLALFRENFEQNGEIERIIHHAKNANEYEWVTHYAPIAARHAASVGAHTEARRLYLSAIEYYQGDNKDLLLQFYECYAYECYLTNKHKEAIIYTVRALNIWKEKNDREHMGNAMQFLSRLWWFEGNRKQAESYGNQAVEVLEPEPSSKAKAMAFNNMSILKSTLDQSDECLFWGEKATAIAQDIEDKETYAHAMAIMGSMLMMDRSSMQQGIELLQKSLKIALENGYHELVARAYTSIGTDGVTIKEYQLAKTALAAGILYCEERDLDSQKVYMLASQARLNLETGSWDEAHHIAGSLLKIEDLFPIAKIGALTVLATIKLRRGEQDALQLLVDARTLAFETMELQRIIPVYLAFLEYEWLTGKGHIQPAALSEAIGAMTQLKVFSKKSRFYFWLSKTGKDHLAVNENPEEKDDQVGKLSVVNDVEVWAKWGCPYEHALALFEGDNIDKKKALTLLQALGAAAVCEKIKQDMRATGIKSIPRGARQSTLSNQAHLTLRELDVLKLLKESLQNKEIGDRLFISAKTVDHHISSILFKLQVSSRAKAVQQALQSGILK